MNVTDPGGGGTAGPVGQTAGRPSLLEYLIAAARRFGADPVLFVATSMRESNLNWDAVGDGGTSFGPFQHHRGGALGNHSPEWAMSPAGVDERAAVFAAAKARSGADAAAIQRPKDPAGYARSVDGYLAQARRYVEMVDGAGGPNHTGPSILSYSGQDLGAVTPVGAVQAIGTAGGAAASAVGSVVSSLFDWGSLRRLVLAAVIVAGGVGLVVTGGVQATKGGA